MKTEVLKKRFFSSRKPGFRLLLWFLIFLTMALLLFIILGYFAALKPVSYLPETNTVDLGSYSMAKNKIKLSNRWYILNVDENGRVMIETPEGATIMSGLTYYAAYEGTDERWGLGNISVKPVSDSTVSILGEGAFDALVNVLLTVHKNTPKMDVNIKTHYNSGTLIRREA
jgi:hypothetical protein